MAEAQVSNAATVIPGTYTPSARTKTIYSVCMFVGLLVFVFGLLKDSSRTWHSFLTSYFYFTSLALGGLFFAAIQHVAKAGWSVNIRRISESLTAYLPHAAIGAVILMVGAKHLYIWLDPEVLAHDALVQGKSAYLNWPFFLIRIAAFFGLWLLFTKLIVGNSIRQDSSGDPTLTLRNVGISVGFLLVFSLSYSLFSIDVLMSLQPHWYSTIWGVYCFAGLFQSSLALIIILTVAMMRRGLLNGLVNENHLHDLGKYLKGFTIFYAYIGFSQFLLIWYANLPEETIFYLARSNGAWMGVTLSLLIFKFIVPFLLLLPRAAKRSPAHLVLVSTLILVMQYVDIYWMVYPNFDSSNVLFSWQEVGVFAMLGGGFLWAVTGFLAKNKLVPIKDPRIDESIHHHVTY